MYGFSMVGEVQLYMRLKSSKVRGLDLLLMPWTSTSKWLRRLPGALALGLLFQISATAHAEPDGANQEDLINPDRPGIADGSNVVGTGRFQVETGIQLEYRRDRLSRERTTFAPTLLRLGIYEGLEARLESNTYTWMKSSDVLDGVSRTDGASPTSIGFKYHFIDGAGIERPSVGAILRVFPPSGSGNFRSRHTIGDFRLAADWDFAPQWSLNPNIGVALLEGSDKRTYMTGLFAATLSYNPSKKLNLFVDMGLQSPEEKGGKSSLIVDVGMAYIIGENLQLDFSLGAGIAGATPPRRFLSAGISKRF